MKCSIMPAAVVALSLSLTIKFERSPHRPFDVATSVSDHPKGAG
jgi:hypothetical protein